MLVSAVNPHFSQPLASRLPGCSRSILILIASPDKADPLQSETIRQQWA
jgi:hypothetical protein